MIAPGQTLLPPANAAAPSGPPLAVPSAAIPAGQVGLVVSARYGRDFAQPINSNLVSRIYPVRPDQSGAFSSSRHSSSQGLRPTSGWEFISFSRWMVWFSVDDLGQL